MFSKLIAKHYRLLFSVALFFFSIITINHIQTSPLKAGENLEVEHVKAEFITFSMQSKTESLFIEQTATSYEEIPFETVYRQDPQLELGLEEVLQEGKNGEAIITYLIRFFDGIEIDREIVNRETFPARERIISRGTKILLRELSTPTGQIVYKQKMFVYATPYTLESAGGNGYTATGTVPRQGTVAVDPTVIPFGTKMFIPGYGVGVAEDTGGAISGEMIDLFYEPNSGWWNSQWVEIYLLAD